MREFYTMTAEEALSALNTGELGLSEQEAEARRKVYGANELRRKKKRGDHGGYRVRYGR